MKQVTMESIRQRIADLESAGKVVGGLSLSSEFELACLRELAAVTEQRDALVVENARLNSAHKSAIDAILNPKNKGVIYLNYTLITSVKTPATDAAIAALRAEGVEMFASETEKLEWHESTTRFVRKFALQLRESKGADHE